jgi:hypothetical protein
MGSKKHRMTIELDNEDLAFLNDLGIFSSTGEGIRFAVKLMRLYSIPALKTIKQKEADRTEAF